jgi:DNA-binding phage protein
MRKVSPAVAYEPIAQDMVRRDPAYAVALLEAATQALVGNELPVARNLIRHLIKGGMGYPELSRRIGTPQTSLVRMFGPRGNPTLANAAAVLAALRRHAGVRLRVVGEPAPKRRRAA